ncbi:TetR/AcrR family transcriptional regulator [Rhodococcus sp. MEB064]|uniref:TetR/AcrR family transcriptional regulator n=1 Tax=Rhodococcus sp. MEB064 TaxID=1587522 RepID=UPI0005ACC902|nr:TetR/AcrR family transcriptional regulator [Rhodococcus sp. MEB064]KIQ17445.1 TetR family transcriptional regulator [Rhodococcus sp. MEB064]
MRPSKTTSILDAAARVVEKDGIAAVTYDSVAAESGITKGGLVYHFPSRESLITALHHHLADAWEAGMAAAAGRTPDQATDTERLRGYVRAAVTSATRAEILFLLEGATTTEHAAPWNTVLQRWVPHAPGPEADAGDVDRFIARLAADGLWMYESLSSDTLDPEVRQKIADAISERIIDR